jgi:glycosyltransferase involved in cell wall biosynthesis
VTTTESLGVELDTSVLAKWPSFRVPRFSIIVPCYHSYETLPQCLLSLQTQTFRSFEAILVDSTPGGQGLADLLAPYPWAQGYVHPQRLGAHAARNLAAGLATGEILAFIDPDMTAHPQWLERLDRQLQNGHSVVGGGVDCPPHYWARTVHLTKYGWWLSGGSARPRTQLPSGNLCLPRSLFFEVGSFPDRYWEGDTELSYRLRDKGHLLWHEPNAVTVHLDVPPWQGFLRERRLRGYDTALARTSRHRWGTGQRLLRSLASPLVWLLMLWRSACHAVGSGWGLRWLLSSPIIAAGLAWWVAGECSGYWKKASSK